MGNYVDGYVIPIQKKNIKTYKKMAQFGCKLWMEHGALSYYECSGDDFVEHGLGFKKMCKLNNEETVIFAFIVYKSKAHRNQVNKKVMSDARMKACAEKIMPFDMKKFSMAGFKVLVKSNV